MHEPLLQDRKESEARIFQSFEEKMTQIRQEMQRESKIRLDADMHIRRYLEVPLVDHCTVNATCVCQVDIPRVYEALKQEAMEREAQDAQIMQRAADEIARLQEAIVFEKKAREDCEESMLRVLEQAVSKLQVEISQERKEREVTEETLVRLLEETCTKLNTASLL